VPEPARTWPGTALKILLPVTGIALVVQYILGLWTNAYAPAAGFTSNTSFPSLDWHYNVGFALGILGILLIVFSALSRRPMNIGLSVVLFAGIAVAGVEGMAFVSTSPNNPVDTMVMGIAFLVSFWASILLGLSVMGGMGPIRTGTSAAS
jgi:hypothetical protein